MNGAIRKQKHTGTQIMSRLGTILSKEVQLTEYRNWNGVVTWGLAVNDYPNLKSPLLDKKIKEFQALCGKDSKK